MLGGRGVVISLRRFGVVDRHISGSNLGLRMVRCFQCRVLIKVVAESKAGLGLKGVADMEGVGLQSEEVERISKILLLVRVSTEGKMAFSVWGWWYGNYLSMGRQEGQGIETMSRRSSSSGA